MVFTYLNKIAKHSHSLYLGVYVYKFFSVQMARGAGFPRRLV